MSVFPRISRVAFTGFMLLFFAGLTAHSCFAQSVAANPASPPVTGQNSKDGSYGDVLKKIEDSKTPMPQLPTAVQAPNAVTGAEALMPLPVEGVAKPGDVAKVPATPATGPAGDSLFFDADSLAPNAKPGLATPDRSVVRQVNPQTEPASEFIIVKKEHGPDSRQAQLVAAQRAIMFGRYDAALSIYDGLYDKNQRDEAVLMGRAAAMQHLGQDEAAIKAYQELLDLKPDNLEAQTNMLGLMGEHYPAVALQRLLDLQQKNSRNVPIIAQIGILQGKMGSYNDALKYLGMAASMDPNNASHFYNMAIVSDRADKKKDAVNYYEKALEVDSVYGGSMIPRDSIYDRLAQIR